MAARNYVTRQALLVAMTVCIVWSPNHVGAKSEEETVQRAISNMASAVTAFPTTRDRHSVLKYFAEEFSSIDDAKRGSLQEGEQMREDTSVCTAILTKTETKWLYLHEHCSSSQSSRDPQLRNNFKLARSSMYRLGWEACPSQDALMLSLGRTVRRGVGDVSASRQ